MTNFIMNFERMEERIKKKQIFELMTFGEFEHKKFTSFLGWGNCQLTRFVTLCEKNFAKNLEENLSRLNLVFFTN
jgi:hypothetical protein